MTYSRKLIKVSKRIENPEFKRTVEIENIERKAIIKPNGSIKVNVHNISGLTNRLEMETVPNIYAPIGIIPRFAAKVTDKYLVIDSGKCSISRRNLNGGLRKMIDNTAVKLRIKEALCSSEGS